MIPRLVSDGMADCRESDQARGLCPRGLIPSGYYSLGFPSEWSADSAIFWVGADSSSSRMQDVFPADGVRAVNIVDEGEGLVLPSITCNTRGDG